MSKREEIISDLLKEVKKEFKDDSLSIASETHFVSKLQFLSSGNYCTNYTLTGNPFKAFPFGRIISFEGPSDSGKTLFACHALKETQAMGGIGILFDVERGTEISRLQKLGIDTDKLLISNAKTLEDVFEKAMFLGKSIKDKNSKIPVTIVFDSLSQASTRHEMESGFDKVDMSRAKYIRSGLRMISSLISDLNICFIIINHQTQKIGGGYRPSHLPPETTVPGGSAVEYFPTMRIEFRKGKTLMDKDLPIGIEVNVKVKKTRIATPFVKTKVEVFFDRGIDEMSGIFEVFLNSGILESPSQGWYVFNGEKKKLRKTDIIDLIKKNKDKYFKMLEKLDNEVVESMLDITSNVKE